MLVSRRVQVGSTTPVDLLGTSVDDAQSYRLHLLIEGGGSAIYLGDSSVTTDGFPAANLTGSVSDLAGKGLDLQGERLFAIADSTSTWVRVLAYSTEE